MTQAPPPPLTPLERQIVEHIKNTSNFDNDFQFMAVTKLTELIQKHHEQIPFQRMQEIVDAFLNQLDSDEKALQNNAIKCLGDIISKLSTIHSKRVVDRIVMRIAKPTTKHFKELGDIYANGLVAIIGQVGHQCGYQLKDLVKVTIDAIYETSEETNTNALVEIVSTQLNLINVLEAFISRWPKIVDTIEFDKAKFVRYLVNNISNPKLSKRSYLCLGALAHSLREKQLRLVLTDQGGLVSKIKEESNYEKKKEYYYALSACLKGKSTFLTHLVPELFKFVFSEIKTIGSNEELIQEEEGVEVVSKLLDSLIISMNSLIHAFPQDFKELPEALVKEIVQELKPLIVFSPVSYIGYIQNEDNEEDEEEEGETDSSYLVRSSTLELVGLFSSINPKICEIFIECSDLFESLKEHKTEVRNASFKMFENLFVGISKQEGESDILGEELPGLRREISVFKEKVPALLTRILTQLDFLLKNPGITTSTRSGCTGLLRQIPRTFLFTLSNDHKLGLVDKLYEIVLAELKRNKSLENQVHLANSIESLARYRDLKYSTKSVELLVEIIRGNKDQNFIKAAFTALAYHLCQGFEGLSKTPEILLKVSALVVEYSKEAKLDQPARISVNESNLMLINHYHTILSKNIISDLLKIILDKISSESNKIHILNGLKTLPQQFTLHPEYQETLNQIVIYIASNLMNNRLALVKEGARNSILAILLILGKRFEPHAATLIKISEILIDNKEFPEYLIELGQLFPLLFHKYVDRLLNLQGVHPRVVAQIIKSNGIKMSELSEVIRKNLSAENLIFCIDLLAIIGVDASDFIKNIQDSLWGCLCLRIVGLSGDQRYYDDLHQYTGPTYGSKIRENARLALGDLSSLHPTIFVPKLVEQIQNSKQKDLDLVFVSIQQCIQRSDSRSYDIIESTLKQFVTMIETEFIKNESVINRVGQSLAKLLSINQFKGVKLLLELSLSKNENIKYLFAVSLNSIEPHLINYELVRRLIELYSDESLKVKATVAKSLSYLININPIEMKQYVTPQLFALIRASAEFNQKLVVVEMIGTKTIIDKGKPLRIQSFFLAEEIILKKIYGTIDLVEFVKIAIDVKNDFYDDVLLHRLDLIKLVTEISPKAFIAVQAEFVRVMSLDGQVLKNYVREQVDEVTKKISLSIARKLFQIIANCRKQNSLILENLEHELKAVSKFKDLAEDDD